MRLSCFVFLEKPVPLFARTARDDGCEFLRGAGEQVRLGSVYVLPSQIVQVVNLTKGTVHLYNCGLRTVCGSWRCGDPMSSHGSKVVFFAVDCSTYYGVYSLYCFCRRCFVENTYLKLGAERVTTCPESSSSDE